MLLRYACRFYYGTHSQNQQTEGLRPQHLLPGSITILYAAGLLFIGYDAGGIDHFGDELFLDKLPMVGS